MQSNKQSLSERFLKYAAASIKLTRKLNKSFAGRHIASQYIRSSTSAGANYEEACGAESKADFIHKMQLVLKELRESSYWIKLILRTEILSGKDLTLLQNEADELIKIISKSLITAKSNK